MLTRAAVLAVLATAALAQEDHCQVNNITSVLYCTALALYCIVLYCTALYCTVLYCQVDNIDKWDCAPDQASCMAAGCCWVPATEKVVMSIMMVAMSSFFSFYSGHSLVFLPRQCAHPGRPLQGVPLGGGGPRVHGGGVRRHVRQLRGQPQHPRHRRHHRRARRRDPGRRLQVRGRGSSNIKHQNLKRGTISLQKVPIIAFKLTDLLRHYY